MSIQRLNPDALFTSPAFSQGTLARGSSFLHVGGQNGVDKDGTMAEGIAAQTARALENVQAVLAAGGASIDDLARLTVYLVASVDPQEAFAALPKAWSGKPTATTVIKVAGLGRPGALVEIEALAIF